MIVSNKTYYIKENPYFIDGERVVGNFTSANHLFHEISIAEYESDFEIWYLDRNNPDSSVLAYANGSWEIEYRYITFENNVDLSMSDYQALIWAYDEYVESKELRISYNGEMKKGRLNGKSKGSITYQGQAYIFDNTK